MEINAGDRVSLCSHNVSQCSLKSEKFSAVHTSPVVYVCVCVCASVSVFAYLCGCAYLVFVQGYKGTFAPGSQPGMNGLSSIIVRSSSGAD